MIPLELKIRNFLSYGAHTETIDFAPHHLICLTGKNGHGKSALLDAITWAIWGQARKVAGIARSDEHLVRLGQSSMSVTLDFLCGGERYRVTRDFSMATNKKGVMQLHLGLFKQEIDAYVSLSERTMRDTQEKLDAIVGLSYDTFINSVFLRQGQANEFSKKSPLERKEILCSLLGLTRYEELRKLAIERQRGYEKEREILSHLNTSLLAELNTRADVAAQAESTAQQLATIESNERELAASLEELGAKQAEAARAQTALALARQAAEQQSQRQGQQLTTIKMLLTERRTYQHRAGSLDAAALAREQEQLSQRLSQLEALKGRQVSMKEQLLNLTAKKQLHLSTLLSELQAQVQLAAQNREQVRFAHERVQTELGEVAKRLTNGRAQLKTLIEKKSTLEQTLSRQKAVDDTVKQLEHQLTRTAQFSARWQLRSQQHEEAHTAAAERLRRLTEQNSTCPLCTQCLPEEHRLLLVAQAERMVHHLSHANGRLQRLLTRLTVQAKKVEGTLKKYLLEKEGLTRSAQELTQTGEQLTQIQAQLAEITTREAELSRLQAATIARATEAERAYTAAAAALETVPTQDATLRALAHEMAMLAAGLDEIAKGLAAADPKKLRARLAEIDVHQKELALLGHERELNKKRRGQILTTIQELRTTRAQQIVLTDEVARLVPAVEALRADEQRMQKNRKALDAILQKKQQLYEQKGALARQCAVLEKRALEQEKNEMRMKELEEQIEDHQLLAQALSKNGIPALIIEQAVPELESEANALLSRLSDNQAQVMFESLRDLKSGGAKETLDIKISDAMGTRPYELFSGGEAFRIDFALRIALSKLLARRAGTTLQTLIIDEGFGSQDEEGLALIQEALHTIQDDFEKVIVVSHLPAMKHQFPTNFIVHKGAEGSTVSVVEQG